MNIVICDDEPEFAEQLTRLVKVIGAKKDWSLQCEAFFSPHALLKADLASVQVVFLDIEMPEMDGLEVAQQLRARYPDIIIVFVSSWIKYAPSVFGVNAFRYLLKNSVKEELEPCFDAIQEQVLAGRESISIKTKDKPVDVSLNDILYFEGTPKRIVLLHFKAENAPHLECMGKLSDFEDALRDKGFLRIQKSFLVNITYVDKMKNYTAFLRTGTELKVSEKNYSALCKQYLMWKGRHI